MKRGIAGKIVAVLVVCCGLQGCLAAAVGYVGYEVGKSRRAVAEKQERTADLANYEHYRIEMEKVNLEREKSKLKPNPIMTQLEWQATQTVDRAPVGK